MFRRTKIVATVGPASASEEMLLALMEAGADVVLFPELAVTGYPPEDLLLRPSFLDAARKSLDAIAAEVTGVAALVGPVQVHEGGIEREGRNRDQLLAVVVGRAHGTERRVDSHHVRGQPGPSGQERQP